MPCYRRHLGITTHDVMGMSEPMAGTILILNGPNLNLLGAREPSTYGYKTLADVDEMCIAFGTRHGWDVETFQSNVEGELVTAIQNAGAAGTPIVLNAGAYTHTSVALRDAIAGSGAVVIETHISNVHAREEFRHTSLIAPVCAGVIAGLGTKGYLLAMQALIERSDADKNQK